MKVLLIDDHPLILSALQSVIQGLGDDVTVVGVDGAVGARATLAEDADFDLVLLDLALGDADGFDLLVELRAAHPAVPVVVVSASERTSDVIRAIDAGAMGFVRHRMPVLRPLAPGLWAATGFGGHGLNTTMLAGELLASALVEGDGRWRLFDAFGLPWNGGVAGPLAAHAFYRGFQLRDAAARFLTRRKE